MTISTFQNIPGLVGFWPMSGVQRSTGDTRDFGGGGLDLTYNGDPTYNIYNDLVPYIDLDGTGDNLTRADETDLDVQGNETIYATAVRGLTVGGWFFIDTAANTGLITKWNTDGATVQATFLLRQNTTVFNLLLSVDGTTVNVNLNAGTVQTGTWVHVVATFSPSAEAAIFIDGVKTSTAAGIPATLFNSTSPLEIGSFNGSLFLLDGRASLCFLSANFLPDAYINALFQQSRVLFGV